MVVNLKKRKEHWQRSYELCVKPVRPLHGDVGLVVGDDTVDGAGSGVGRKMRRRRRDPSCSHYSGGQFPLDLFHYSVREEESSHPLYPWPS